MRALLLIALLAGCLMPGKQSSTLAPNREEVAASGTSDVPIFITRENFHSLRGLTVEAAKAQARKYGHDGNVKVEEMDDFVPGCQEGAVCTATDEVGGQSGMSVHDVLLLRTNKTLSIAPPPD